MELLLQQLMNALAVGSIYALIALGYTMVYGVLNLVNFAHSELFMLGAFVGLAVIGAVSGGSAAEAGVLLTLAAAAIAFALVGATAVGVERLAYRPLRGYARLAPMLSALASAIVIQNGVMLIAGRQPHGFPNVLPSWSLDYGALFIDGRQIAVFVVAMALFGGLYAFVHGTKVGVQIRAVSESHVTAQLCGVNVNRVIGWVFFLGGGIGAVGGMLYASYYGVASFTMGFVVGLKAFTAAILGGVGNIAGAVVGGLLLGALETAGAGLLPILTNGAGGAEYRDIFAFATLILVLLLKPAGIFGQAVSEETLAARKDF